MKRNIFLITGVLFIFSLCSCAVMEAFSNADSETINELFESGAGIVEAAQDLTPENEYYLGRAVAASIIHTYPLIKVDERITDYLNKICYAITSNSTVPTLYKGYYVAVLDSDEINAMATPGGHIFISRGLLERVESEDEIAAVIAHEVSHIQLKHSVKAIQSGRITNSVIKTARSTAKIALETAAAGTGIDTERLNEAADALSNSVGDIVKTLVTSGFSKAQEFDADSLALYLMTDAGYDANSMLDMLNLISTVTDEGGWSKTHPKPEERIQKVQEELKLIQVSTSDKTPRIERFNRIMER